MRRRMGLGDVRNTATAVVPVVRLCIPSTAAAV